MDLVKTNDLVTCVWEFCFDSYRVRCQHIEGAGGVHIIVVTENDVLVERHEFTEHPGDPTASLRLNEIRSALRGIYQARFARAVHDRRNETSST